ncbi:hypothetical protein CAEBREN_28450, partial [Caenorhabditis brenneri]
WIETVPIRDASSSTRNSVHPA